MKNLLIAVFAIFMLASCSKESALISEISTLEKPVSSNLSVAAVYAGTATSTTTEAQTCGANYVENTEVALFFEQDNVTAETDMASAAYVGNTGNGIAYFTDLKPGNYTVLAVNDMGSKVKISKVKIGSNDVSIEF